MTNQFKCNTCGGVYFEASAQGIQYAHTCGSTSDKAGNPVEIPNARNENVVFNASGRLVGMVSEGTGVKCINNPKLTEPQWFTDMKAADAKKEGTPNAPGS